MAQKIAPLLPATAELLLQFGDRLRLARLRRRLSAKQVAERSGMAPMTLRSLERGGSGVTIGAYLAVMQVLGIEKDLGLLGTADPLGRDLQDARLPMRSQASPKFAQLAMDSAQRREIASPRVFAAGDSAQQTKVLEDTPDWIAENGFASSQALAGLLAPAAVVKKRR